MEILANCAPTATTRPPPLVMLTGGLNTLPRMTSALAHDHAHLLGVARLSVTHPRAPAEIAAALSRGDASVLSAPPALPTPLGNAPPSRLSVRALERLFYYLLRLLWVLIPAQVPRIIGASASVQWYNIMLRRIAFGHGIDYTLGTIGATLRCYLAPTPYLPEEGDAAWKWWIAAAFVGVAMGIGLGQVA